MKLVLVEWVDSAELFGWQSKRTIPTVVKVATVGYVTDENEKELTVISSTSECQEKGCMSIPKCAITRIRKLGVK